MGFESRHSGRRREKGDAVRAAKVAIRALRLKHPRTRPTYEAVREAAHVGTETVAKAFEELEQAGEEVGEKVVSGRLKGTFTGSKSPAPIDPEPDEPPLPMGPLVEDVETGEVRERTEEENEPATHDEPPLGHCAWDVDHAAGS